MTLWSLEQRCVFVGAADEAAVVSGAALCVCGAADEAVVSGAALCHVF